MKDRNLSSNVKVSQQRAKALRQSMTPAEAILWQRLRGKQLADLRFRRQKPIGPYIADFLCFEARLIVELDGCSHEESFEKDRQKDHYLEQREYRVLRFNNDEINRNLDGVLETILEKCHMPSSPTQPPPEGDEITPTILLIGFMGCGKSSVARLLAQRLNYGACDIDTLIENAAGKPIPQIFAEEGEEAFRQQETAQLKNVLQNQGKPSIVATGGGIVTRPENRELLKNAAQSGVLVVYLKASPAVLAQRIRLQPGKRPLIDGNGELNLQQTRNRVGELLQTRSPLYEDVAKLIVDTDTLTLDEVVRQIMAAAIKM